MDLMEAIAGRKSIRDFKPDPVPKQLLQKILDAAIKAPSNANRQMWEFLVVTGNSLKDMVASIEQASATGKKGGRDLPSRDPNHPMPEEGSKRSNELVRSLVEVTRQSGMDPGWFFKGNFRFFSAPCVVLVMMDKGYGTGSLVSIGAAIQNLLLAAHACGLGTCWMVDPLEYGNVLREKFSIPESKYLVSSVAIGYARDSKINEFKSSRDPLEKVIKFFN